MKKNTANIIIVRTSAAGKMDKLETAPGIKKNLSDQIALRNAKEKIDRREPMLELQPLERNVWIITRKEAKLDLLHDDFGIGVTI